MHLPRRIHHLEEDTIDTKPHLDASSLRARCEYPTRLRFIGGLDDVVDVPNHRRRLGVTARSSSKCLSFTTSTSSSSTSASSSSTIEVFGLSLIGQRFDERRRDVRRRDQNVLHRHNAEATLDVIQQKDIVGVHGTDRRSGGLRFRSGMTSCWSLQ